jgi:hypothetical protein
MWNMEMEPPAWRDRQRVTPIFSVKPVPLRRLALAISEQRELFVLGGRRSSLLPSARTQRWPYAER